MAKQAIAFDDLTVKQQTIAGVTRFKLKPWPSEKPPENKHAFNNPDVQRYARWKRIQTALQSYDEHVQAILADNNLSAQGKFEKVTQLKEGVAADFAEINHSLDSSIAEIGRIDARINAEIDMRITRNSDKHSTILQWMATVPAELRGDAWRHAKVDGDTEFYECALSMNPTIRKIMLPTLKPDDIGELRDKVAAVAVPAQVAERTALHAETTAIVESLLAAERYIKRDVIVGGPVPAKPTAK